MHELALCQSLLREVERVAKGRRASAVSRITVAIGPLAGVEPPLLARAFSIARLGTLAEAASLEIETAPIIVACRLCQAESVAAVNALVCAECGAWQVDLKSGDDLRLQSLELELDDAAVVSG